MRRVLATAGHVDHGKSTLVRALTGRDPDRLAEERDRGLTIELGFVWTTLPGGADVAFVDVPGHQRFIGTMLAGLGPSPAVVFVVAADQGWQEQSSEHLAAVQALGIRDGLLVITRADLADEGRRSEVADEATTHLASAGLDLPATVVSAMTGEGMEQLRAALEALVVRMPEPDDHAPVRLWSDRSFVIKGAGTVVTGTLGTGTVRAGDRLTLLEHGRSQEVVVRGLHSEDEAREAVAPVARAAVNLRRAEDVGRSVVLLTPGAFELATSVDVAVVPVATGDGADPGAAVRAPEQATLHVGTTDIGVHVRPFGDGWARLSSPEVLPWRVGDRAILRDPGSRRIWSVRVVDVDPLPLRRRGAARQRGEALESVGAASAGVPGPAADLAALRLRSRSADTKDRLRRLGLPVPTEAVPVGSWRVDPDALQQWRTHRAGAVALHHRDHPLSAGLSIADAGRALGLPEHLRDRRDGGTLGDELDPPAVELVHHLAPAAGLAITDGRVHDPSAGGLGDAEGAVATLETKLRETPFVAPERGELADLGLGAAELAAAERLGRVLRLPDDVVLLPDGPARAMRVLAGLEQPFTLSEARQALGTTRRTAVPLLEHLDSRGWTRRVDGRLREVVR